MEDLIQKEQGWGRTFQKLCGTIFFARKGDKPEKGVDVEMGGVLLFLLLFYSSVQSHLPCVGGKCGIPLLLLS